MRVSLVLIGLAAVLEVVLLARLPEPTRRGASVFVPAGGDLQAALNGARPGDVITLEPGATYIGNFKLPATPGSESEYITIRSAADPSQFFADGRVGPEHERWMPVLRSPTTAPALATSPGAHHWKLQWLAFHANLGGFGDIITLGDGGANQRELAAVPHDLVLDGLIVRGDPIRGQKRAIALNSAATVIRNSDIRDIKAAGQDSQAICGWNGPGPFVIENNYLEAAGENIMFGGADPKIPNLVPSDITITANYITKPLEWRGTRWTVKNLFELKSARRVLIERNVFEHNWLHAQAGYAILFSPTNQNGGAPWTVVSDVTFRLNVVRHVSSVFNMSGYGWQHPTQQTRGIEIRNNLFYGVDGALWGGAGRFMMAGPEPADIVVDHNTIVHTGSIVHFHGKKAGRPRPIRNFQFTNNLVRHNTYGIMGDDSGPGKLTISDYLVREDIRRNVIAGAPASRYPSDNFYPSVEEFVRQFVAPGQDDYRLLPTSPFVTAATDGSAVGADIDAILRDAPEREPRERKNPRRTPPDIR